MRNGFRRGMKKTPIIFTFAWKITFPFRKNDRALSGLIFRSFYQRFIEGRRVAAEGLVYPFMEEPDRFLPPPEGGPFEEFIVSCDYGTVNPASFGLWGRKEGVWYRLKEYYYDSKRDGARKPTKSIIRGL